jgi:multidrug efflux pump subunit AcrA (membrane-fusion protein)
MKSILKSILPALVALSGCGESQIGEGPTETLVKRAWIETLTVEGEINAAEKTPLIVPGSGWENRALIAVVYDGSTVRKGEVVARFDAPRARMELSQAEAELLRKLLSEANVNAVTAMSQAELSTESAGVETNLALSRRYANADLSFFARNQILDALQDVDFLTTKHGYLQWKAGQVDVRGTADRAVVLSQKESVALTASQKRKSLAALDLVAPHDGVFRLVSRWDGTKPQIGASLWTGQEFGSLPNLETLVAQFNVAEGQAFGLKAGLPVRVRLTGTGVEIDLKVTKVGSSASTKNRDSPVKYTDFEAAIDHETALRLDLKPGQALSGTVRLVDKPDTLTVPNVALVQDGAAFAVLIADGSRVTKQLVELGMRGPIRSEILSGVKAGTNIALLPHSAKTSL